MKRTLQTFVLLSVIVLLMIRCNVIWISPKMYTPTEPGKLEPSLMNLQEYTSSGLIDKHPRPMIYIIESTKNKGAVLVFGAEHSKDPSHRQVAIMQEQWKKFTPTVAMLEGRIGFLFSWAQNPIKEYGESGLTAKMAKGSKKVKLYSWEAGRGAEIDNIISRKLSIAHLVAMYALQQRQNQWFNFSKKEQDKMINGMISKRTRKYVRLRGYISSVEQVDSLWKADYPGELSWRTYRHPRNGWPEGAFKQIAETTNDIRNEHLCHSVIELVNKGERVFVSMGSSHAAVIERTLRGMIK